MESTVNSVSNTAGPIALQVIPYSPHSTAMFLVKFITPPLAEEYALIPPPGKITLEWIEPMLMILPYSCSIMISPTALHM